MEFLKLEYASDSSESETDLKVEVNNSAANKIEHACSNEKEESCAITIKQDFDKDSEENKEGAVNYFGLSAYPDSFHDEQDDTSKDTDKSVSQVVKVGDTTVEVEVPSTSFWRDTTSMDIQALQKQRQYSKMSSSLEHASKTYKGELFDASGATKRVFSSLEVSNPGNKGSKASKHGRTAIMSSPNPELSNKVSVSTSKQPSERKLYFIHPKITPLLHTTSQHSRPARSVEWSQVAHSGAVNRLQWCTANYSHLFASCSMDCMVKVWNPWSQLEPCVKQLTIHRKAVKDLVWSRDGKQLLTASYDRTAAVTDVEKGSPVHQFEHTSYVTCAKYHPVNPYLCVTGEHNAICAWDTRQPRAPCRTFSYKDSIGQMQDLLFSDDGCTLFSCSDLVTKDSADRNLMAWDFTSGVTLSNQIYQERYTVARLKGHRRDGQFLAQSQGNYIAMFSLTRPYKMCKHKRLEGHKVQGYSIGFDVTPDGQAVYSGSSDGRLYRYNYQSGRLSEKLDTGMDVVMDVACHPLLPSTLVAGGWDGKIQVWR